MGGTQRRQWQDLLLESSLPSDSLEDTAWRPDCLGRREGRRTGTGAPVPVATLFLLFLLSEERYRQPRAVYKYWAGGLPSCDHAATCFNSSSSFMADMDQKDRCSCMYKAGIMVTLHLALCSLHWLAGPGCSAFWPVRT